MLFRCFVFFCSQTFKLSVLRGARDRSLTEMYIPCLMERDCASGVHWNVNFMDMATRKFLWFRFTRSQARQGKCKALKGSRGKKDKFGVPSLCPDHFYPRNIRSHASPWAPPGTSDTIFIFPQAQAKLSMKAEVNKDTRRP
jgi:hypothetical protein